MKWIGRPQRREKDVGIGKAVTVHELDTVDVQSFFYLKLFWMQVLRKARKRDDLSWNEPTWLQYVLVNYNLPSKELSLGFFKKFI